jgi:hypothetical protein
MRENKKVVKVMAFTEEEYQEIEQYAKSKMLEFKSFVKFAAKSYMDKYPRKATQSPRAVQPNAL